MKSMFSMAFGLCFFLLNVGGCEKKGNTDALCNQFSLNKTFTSKIDELWCLDTGDLSIRFGPMVEDSRCNVDGIECIWAGRYVLESTIIKSGGEKKDTFLAVHNWSDTLHQSPYRIIMQKVYPETRTDTEALDPSKYSFDIRVEQE